MKEMKFIGGRGYVVGQNEIHYPSFDSVSFVLIHDKELLLGDKGMLFEHEFHFDLQQIHREQFKTVLSCSALVSYS